LTAGGRQDAAGKKGGECTKDKNKEQKQNTSHTKNHVGKRGKKQVATWAGVRLNKYHRFFFSLFSFLSFFSHQPITAGRDPGKEITKAGKKKKRFFIISSLEKNGFFGFLWLVFFPFGFSFLNHFFFLSILLLWRKEEKKKNK